VSKEERQARRKQRALEREAAKQAAAEQAAGGNQAEAQPAEASAVLTDTAAHRKPEARQPLVWVCDDDRMIVQLMQANLGRLGLRAARFYDGSEVLEALERCSADDSLERPVALLLDNLMPRVSGVQVLRAKGTMCREERHEWLADLSVIVMSGEASVAAKQEFRRTGAHAVVSKPVEISIMVEELQSLGVLQFQGDDERDEDAC
jgi:two-component system alkaline phosphatase synthesis response regulator PhoP/two-component system response regulator VicR